MSESTRQRLATLLLALDPADTPTARRPNCGTVAWLLTSAEPDRVWLSMAVMQAAPRPVIASSRRGGASACRAPTRCWRRSAAAWRALDSVAPAGPGAQRHRDRRREPHRPHGSRDRHPARGDASGAGRRARGDPRGVVARPHGTAGALRPSSRTPSTAPHPTRSAVRTMSSSSRGGPRGTSRAGDRVRAHLAPRRPRGVLRQPHGGPRLRLRPHHLGRDHGIGHGRAFAKNLAALARFDRIAAISAAAATEYRGWPHAVGAGIAGPGIEDIMLRRMRASSTTPRWPVRGRAGHGRAAAAALRGQPRAEEEPPRRPQCGRAPLA